MQATPSSQNITIKILLTLILLLIDLIINSFIEVSFSLSSQSIHSVNFYFLVHKYQIQPIQIIITSLILIMILLLMWQTFPLRYGLISTLIKQFKWTFSAIIIFIIISALQRGIKLSIVISKSDNFSQVDVWSFNGYVALYYIRYLCYPIFYASIVAFCMRIIDPSFYKPYRWLQ